MFNYILGGDSITVILDAKSYTVNKQAHTYPMVLSAVKSQDVTALRNALDVRSHIAAELTKTAGDMVRIESNQIFYGDREVTGLIASRIFEVIRQGLDVKPMVKFLENLMSNPSKRAVDELFGFLDACKLPITSDGHFLAYKRVRNDYRDCHSGTMDNSIGKVLEMPRNTVDEDKNRTCSSGLHFCSYDYLQHFGGDRIVVLKINPASVVCVPADYNNSKGRTCRYEVVDELPLNEFKLPERTIVEDFTDEFEDDDDPDWVDPDLDETCDNHWGKARLDKDDTDAVIERLEAVDGNDWDFDIEVGELADDLGVPESIIREVWEEHVDNFWKTNTLTRVNKSTVSAPVAPVLSVSTNNSSAKLTPDDVRAIRKSLAKGTRTLADIAEDHEVSPRTIARIRDGEAWVNVK